MKQEANLSFVELFEDIDLPLPKEWIAFAGQVFDWFMAQVYKVHDFLCRSRDS